MAGTELILWRRVYRSLRLLCCVVVLLAAAGAAMASEYHGIVRFNGLPVPGVTVTVTQGGKKFVTVTDTQGFYSFPTLADGAASIDLEMTGFSTIKQDVTVTPDGAMAKWDLKLMSLEEIRTAVKPVVSAGIAVAATRSEPKKTSDAPKPAADQPPAAPPPEETVQRAADGLVVNGSVNNAATSQFSMAQRFGNTASGKSRYNFSLYLTVGNSALSAKSYSSLRIRYAEAGDEPDYRRVCGAGANKDSSSAAQRAKYFYPIHADAEHYRKYDFGAGAGCGGADGGFFERSECAWVSRCSFMLRRLGCLRRALRRVSHRARPLRGTLFRLPALVLRRRLC